MDRGFYSLDNIVEFVSNNISFLVGGKENINFIYEYLNVSATIFDHQNNYFDLYDIYGLTYKHQLAYRIADKKTGFINKKTTLFVHVFYDMKKQAEQKAKFYNSLNDAIDAIYTNSYSDDQKKLVDKFCIFKTKKNKEFKIEYNDVAIYNHSAILASFALISNSITQAEEAIKIYRQKDAVEKAFHYTKSSLKKGRTTGEHTR
jgi:transposase